MAGLGPPVHDQGDHEAHDEPSDGRVRGVHGGTGHLVDGAEDGPVISPYSAFLTLSVLRKDAIANLRRMASMNWLGNFGFYESADYTSEQQPELVRSWMAHHQGMCLLALTNLLSVFTVIGERGIKMG